MAICRVPQPFVPASTVSCDDFVYDRYGSVHDGCLDRRGITLKLHPKMYCTAKVLAQIGGGDITLLLLVLTTTPPRGPYTSAHSSLDTA